MFKLASTAVLALATTTANAHELKIGLVNDLHLDLSYESALAAKMKKAGPKFKDLSPLTKEAIRVFLMQFNAATAGIEVKYH